MVAAPEAQEVIRTVNGTHPTESELNVKQGLGTTWAFAQVGTMEKMIPKKTIISM